MSRGIAAWALLLTIIAAPGIAAAQTIGFADAIDRVAAHCNQDIDKFCKSVNLGRGRILQCLDSKAGVSGQCKTTIAEVRALLAARAEARRQVPRVCDADIRRLCAGVQAGDGNLMECFYKAKARVSQPCQRAVAAAGYE